MMISSSVRRVVLCGSFRRDRKGLFRAYDELITNGCQVMSPHRMDFDESEFVRDAAEVSLSTYEIEKHHLTAITQADFVWLFAPEGYIGLSAAMEIGFAIAKEIPIFTRNSITIEPHKDFVTQVASVYDVLVKM